MNTSFVSWKNSKKMPNENSNPNQGRQTTQQPAQPVVPQVVVVETYTVVQRSANDSNIQKK